MKITSIAVATLLSLASGAALAHTPIGIAQQAAFGTTSGPSAGQALFTARGPIVATGRVGNMETTTLPGGGGVGFLTNNGNGTSTLIGPGLTTTIPTPR